MVQLSQWLVGFASTVLAVVGLEKVPQALEVQRINGYKDLVPFAQRRSPRVRRAGLHCTGYAPVDVGGHQHWSAHLVRQVPDTLQRLQLVPVGQTDHARGVRFQLLGTEGPRVPVAAQGVHIRDRVVHVLGGHVAPAQRLTVGNDVPGDVNNLQHLQDIHKHRR